MSARAYYNEHDPKAAAWLRELIKAGLIAPGDVDTRDIQLIQPHELSGYTQQHFFAGIGGWSRALRLAGWPDGRAVRTGSCPCQPFSDAGLRRGEADERHLWPYFRDLITFGEATATFGEQVASSAGRLWLARVRADLEGLGYAVGAADLCAAGIGAPHIRQRLYWVAHAEKLGRGAWWSGGTRDDAAAAQPPGLRDVGGMAHCDGQRLAGRPEQDQRSNQPELDASRRADAVRCGDASRMAYASSMRRYGATDTAESAGRTLAANGINLGHWSEFELLPCLDGKARRIEPGSFPLDHGVPGRVGLLRGYGNAIVPEVAAEFIQAAIESGIN